MEKQRNRGNDGAGVANVKLDVPPGVKYINVEKSVAADPIKDLFERVQGQAHNKLQKAPQSACTSVNGKTRIDPGWVKEHVPFSGEAMLAHVRYGTDSENGLDKCHPMTRESNWMTRNLILAGNFNITNNEDLFASLVQLGQHPRELSDTVMLLEKVGHFVDKENNDLYVKYSAAGHDPRTAFSLIAENLNVARILRRASADWDGGYCIAGMFGHGDAFVMRDPSGIRPAFYYADEDIVVVASEAPLIQTVFSVREEFVHPVPPGQALIVKRSGAWSLEKILEPLPLMQCSFERIYFSRGNDAGVYWERGQLGRFLLEPLLKMLEKSGDDLNSAVLSFIPNTSELAFLGMVKEAQDYLDRQKQSLIKELVAHGKTSGADFDAKVRDVLAAKVRMEKVIHKDAKIRTFIQEESNREHLTMHAYDIHYGTIRRNQDVIVALDDSIVRGNTLKNAILRTLDGTGPKRIIIVSSCPQIRFPDVYGIDMAKLGDLAAFKAAVDLIRERKMEHVLTDVYNRCRAELSVPIKNGTIINHMRRIYDPFTPQELSDRIAQHVTPPDCSAKVEILFQTVEDMHKALPDHAGDWYFTGNYPTQGGAKVCCRAFVLWMEGSDQRCYGVNSSMARIQNPVLVLGNGGREHALAWKLSKSADVSCVYVAPGNGGIGQLSEDAAGLGNAPMVPLDLKIEGPHFMEVAAFCKEQGVTLVVVGPEQMLADGVVDALKSQGIPVFGPSKAAAELESSKVFSKAFMGRHKIPTAEHATFKGFTEMDAALKYVDSVPFDVVVKASGLAAGKGVVVPSTKAEAAEAVRACLQHKHFGSAGEEIVLERKLEGVECTVLCLTDGTSIAVLPASQDHKRAFDNDKGPNTGGMGAYAPTPLVKPELLERIEREILRPCIDGLRQEGRPFVGCLYAGLMLTTEGPKVIEFNCRFGDPEAQVVLPLLDCDFYEVLLNCVSGRLSESVVRVLPKTSAVAVVMASGGYPGPYESGHTISGLDRARCVPGITIFHAGTKSATGFNTPPAPDSSRTKLLRRSSRSWSSACQQTLTSELGGRVLAVTAVGRGITEARERAYVAIRSIQFTGAHYRMDVAQSASSVRKKEQSAKARLSADAPTYLAAGVDLSMDDAIHASTQPLLKQTFRPGCEEVLEDNPFAGLCSMTALKYDDPLMVSSTSAVGTKLKVATFQQKFDSVGVDLVALCANDVVACGAEPVFFMDHFATSKLDAHQALQVVQGVANGCKEARCSLIAARHSEMPGIFSSSSFDLVGFAVGVVERSAVLPKKDLMKTGDVLIGLQSSGLHSNGFSLVRSLAQAAGVRYNEAAPFDPTQSFGEVLMTPTRIYTRAVLPLAKAGKLKGVVPITSGGLTRSIPRILPQELQAQLRSDTWELPAVFRWIAGSFKMSCREMATTFNCGIGMVLVIAQEDVDEVIRTLKDLHEEPLVIGELAPHTDCDDQVQIEGAESSWLMLPELGVSLPFPQVISSLHDPLSISKARVLVLGGSAATTPLQALLEAAEMPAFPAEVSAVASGNPQSPLVLQARAAGVDTYVIGNVEAVASQADASAGVQKPTASFSRQLEIVLQNTSTDLVIVLDDFKLSLLDSAFRQCWQGKLVTIQAALMPTPPGVDAIQTALNLGMRVTGCTVYRGIPDAAAAGSILSQETTRVDPSDTSATLHARVVMDCEWKALPDAVRSLVSDLGEQTPKPRSAAATFAPVSRASGDAQRYEMRGVSADKGDVHAAIKDMDKGLFPKAFCKVVPDNITNDPSQALVMHADGAGTKASLAYMYWRKTGDLSVWKGIAQDAIVMNLDDLLCVGVTDNILLSSTIGRNKNLIPGDVIASLISGTEALTHWLGEHGVSVSLTGGETADVGDLVRTIIVDSTVTARIPRAEIIDNGRICAGDIIVGLSSSGRATYEDEYNSGIGSNGLTAARHDTFEKGLATEFPESFDPAMPDALVYSGGLKLEELVDAGEGGTLPAGKLLLSPTRTYAPVVKKIFDSGLRERIHGMVHCSGGAQTKVLHFVSDVHVVKDNLFPTPPVFQLIQQHSQTSWEEMYKVFNMGHRMEFYTDKETAGKIIEISKSFGIEAQVVGRVDLPVTPGEKRVTITSEHGEFEYKA